MWNPKNILPHGWTALRLLWTPADAQPKRDYLEHLSYLNSDELDGMWRFTGAIAASGSFVGSLALTLGIMAGGAMLTSGTEKRWDFGVAWIDAARQDAMAALSSARPQPLMLNALDLSSIEPGMIKKMNNYLMGSWDDSFDVSEGGSPRSIRKDLELHASDPWGVVWDARLIGNATSALQRWRAAVDAEAVEESEKLRERDAAMLNAEFIRAIAAGLGQEEAAKRAVKNTAENLSGGKELAMSKQIAVLHRAFAPQNMRTFKAPDSALARLAGQAEIGWQRDALRRYAAFEAGAERATLAAAMGTMAVLMLVSAPLLFFIAAFRVWAGHARTPLTGAAAYWSLASAARRPAKGAGKRRLRL